MPTFDITSPEGKTFRITAPDGATKEQALAYAKSNMPVPGNHPAPPGARPTGPLPGEPGYGAHQPKEQPSGLLDYALSQGGRFERKPAAERLFEGAMAGSEAFGGMGPAAQAAGKGVQAAGKGVQAAGKGAALVGNAAASLPGTVARGLVSAEPRLGAAEAIGSGYRLPPKMANVAPTKVSEALAGMGGKVKTEQFAAEANQKVTNQLAAKALGLKPDTALTGAAFQSVRQEAGKAYRAIKDILPPVPLDMEFKQALNNLTGAPAQLQKAFPKLTKTNPLIQDLISELGSKSRITGSEALELTKRLRNDASANFKARMDPDKLALGYAQQHAADAIEHFMERGIKNAPTIIARHMRDLGSERSKLIADIGKEKNVLSRLMKLPESEAATVSGQQASPVLKSSESRIREMSGRLSEIAAEMKDATKKAVNVSDLKSRASILQNFRDARKRIAMSYDVEKATNSATQDVAAHRLASLAQMGRPLSGELRSIANAYSRFPQAMRAPATFGHPEQFSVLDTLVGGGALLSGHPEGLAVLGRPLARSTVLSPLYQRMMIGK